MMPGPGAASSSSSSKEPPQVELHKSPAPARLEQFLTAADRIVHFVTEVEEFRETCRQEKCADIRSQAEASRLLLGGRSSHGAHVEREQDHEETKWRAAPRRGYRQRGGVAERLSAHLGIAMSTTPIAVDDASSPSTEKLFNHDRSCNRKSPIDGFLDGELDDVLKSNELVLGDDEVLSLSQGQEPSRHLPRPPLSFASQIQSECNRCTEQLLRKAKDSKRRPHKATVAENAAGHVETSGRDLNAYPWPLNIRRWISRELQVAKGVTISARRHARYLDRYQEDCEREDAERQEKSTLMRERSVNALIEKDERFWWTNTEIDQQILADLVVPEDERQKSMGSAPAPARTATTCSAQNVNGDDAVEDAPEPAAPDADPEQVPTPTTGTTSLQRLLAEILSDSVNEETKKDTSSSPGKEKDFARGAEKSNDAMPMQVDSRSSDDDDDGHGDALDCHDENSNSDNSTDARPVFPQLTSACSSSCAATASKGTATAAPSSSSSRVFGFPTYYSAQRTTAPGARTTDTSSCSGGLVGINAAESGSANPLEASRNNSKCPFPTVSGSVVSGVPRFGRGYVEAPPGGNKNASTSIHPSSSFRRAERKKKRNAKLRQEILQSNDFIAFPGATGFGSNVGRGGRQIFMAHNAMTNFNTSIENASDPPDLPPWWHAVPMASSYQWRRFLAFRFRTNAFMRRQARRRKIPRFLHPHKRGNFSGVEHGHYVFDPHSLTTDNLQVLRAIVDPKYLPLPHEQADNDHAVSLSSCSRSASANSNSISINRTAPVTPVFPLRKLKDFRTHGADTDRGTDFFSYPTALDRLGSKGRYSNFRPSADHNSEPPSLQKFRALLRRHDGARQSHSMLTPQYVKLRMAQLMRDAPEISMFDVINHLEQWKLDSASAGGQLSLEELELIQATWQRLVLREALAVCFPKRYVRRLKKHKKWTKRFKKTKEEQAHMAAVKQLFPENFAKRAPAAGGGGGAAAVRAVGRGPRATSGRRPIAGTVLKVAKPFAPPAPAKPRGRPPNAKRTEAVAWTRNNLKFGSGVSLSTRKR